jgi:hypothetical protein
MASEIKPPERPHLPGDYISTVPLQVINTPRPGVPSTALRLRSDQNPRRSHSEHVMQTYFGKPW